MHDYPTDWTALCLLATLLGLRHGLDADHLAAIDGLTRSSSRQQLPHARFCGALFSLGHGLIVMAIALVAGTVGAGWEPPHWLEATGALISIGFLTAIGFVNLRAVWLTPADQVVALVGMRGRLVDRLLGQTPGRSGALAVLGIGALFALSFDTISQAALFAVMAVHFGSLGHVLTLGALFVVGMLISDGVNGWWIARLIRRTDRLALVASRTMTFAVAVVSLLIASLGAARLGSVWVDNLFEGKELFVGLAVIGLILLSYLAARHAARHQGAVAT